MYLHLETENPYETESMQAEIALINRCIKQVQQDETIDTNTKITITTKKNKTIVSLSSLLEKGFRREILKKPICRSRQEENFH